MHSFVHLCAASAVAVTGTALAAAGLSAISSSQPRHQDVQLVDTAQYVYDLGQSEITTGITQYSHGDFIDGLTNISIGEANVAVDAPQDALLEQIEDPTQAFQYVVTNPADLPVPHDAGQLASNLQFIYDAGVSALQQANSDFAAGATNLGLAETFIGDDDLAVNYTQAALEGQTFLNIANTGNPAGIPENIYGLIDPASYGDDSTGYLTNGIETEVVGPITEFAKVAGVDLGPVGNLLSAADAVNTFNEFTDHWDGFLAGNEVDSLHVGIEYSDLLFTAAGAMTAPDFPPLAVGFDAIATGLGGLDTLLTNTFG